MTFSDSANKSGLVEEIDFVLGTDSTSYPIAQKTRNINSWYNRVASLIMRADSRWEWDDNNRTDFPIATAALVANQQDYAITGASFLNVLKVEIKDRNGNWTALSPISLDDKRNESITDYQKTAGTPIEYDKFGNSIFLYPKPSYSQDASLKVFYQRNVSLFSVDDTTKVPGFAENFHRILSYGASYDYCLAYSLISRVPILREEIAKLESGLIDFYSERAKDEKTTLSLQGEEYGADFTENSVNWQ
jgi:hypothetical protein